MKQTIFIHGILAGIVTIAYAFLVYTTQKTFFFTMPFAISSLIIYVLAMYLAAKRAISEDFRSVLRAAFAVFLIANALYYVFDFTLFNHIDTSLARLQADLAIVDMKLDTPLEQQIQREEDILSADIHNVGSLIKRYLKAAIGGFTLSVLVAYLVKRQQF